MLRLKGYVLIVGRGHAHAAALARQGHKTDEYVVFPQIVYDLRRKGRRAADQNYRSPVAIHPLLTMPFPYDKIVKFLLLHRSRGLSSLVRGWCSICSSFRTSDDKPLRFVFVDYIDVLNKADDHDHRLA